MNIMRFKISQRDTFLIGYHFDGRYVIDTNKSKNGLGFMLYLDSIDDIEDAINLDSNLEIWFDIASVFKWNEIWEVNPNLQEYYKLVSE